MVPESGRLVVGGADFAGCGVGKVKVVFDKERDPADVGYETPDAAKDGDGLATFLYDQCRGIFLAGAEDIPGAANERRLKILADNAKYAAGRVNHIVAGSKVDNLAGLDAEGCLLLLVVGKKVYPFFERKAFLFGKGDHRARYSALIRLVKHVAVDEEGELLVDKIGFHMPSIHRQALHIASYPCYNDI